MEKKGFFKMNGATLVLLAIIWVIDILMFTPGIFNATTKFGTSLQYVFVNIVLFLAPCCALLDGYIKTKKEEKAKK